VQRYASAVYVMALCPSIHHELVCGCSIEMAKCEITFWCMTAQDSSLLMPKISAKFQWVTSNGGIKYRWGQLKLAVFKNI